ncbi:hypothetical protein BDU57DRAFT_450389 [Ampelomyces quisqualis]|uniref:2EXR domain-containing protein n=1 Tax=Ampelomyces quisqualis TaxID=50730 RepID=A0A6A5QLJ4_AMPQU|nr:hypothetical protein BDU57DRAFT_450389 [Ampelomyces quisqualis]
MADYAPSGPDPSFEDVLDSTYSVETEASTVKGIERPTFTETSTVAVPLPSFSRFMDFPVELREMIWDRAMRGTVHPANMLGNKFAEYLVTPVEIREFLKTTNNTERPNFLPPLCRISKSTKNETIGVYLRGSKFMVASFLDNRLLDGFLQTAPKAYEAIRSIHFAFFDCYPGPEMFEKNSDLELAVRCTGLRSVKLTFHMSRLCDLVKRDPYDDGEYYPRSVEDMWTYYKLARLMDCENLENVDIQRKGRSRRAVECGVTVSQDLGVRIKAEYDEKHHGDLNVTYSWF